MSSLNVSIEQAKRSTQDKSCFAALVAKFLPVQLHGNRFTTLGARDFSSAVSGFGTAEDVSAFGQHRKFPPHARKTSGTQGTGLPSWRILTVLYCEVVSIDPIHTGHKI